MVCPLFISSPVKPESKRSLCLKTNCAWWCKEKDCCGIYVFLTNKSNEIIKE